MHYEDSNLKMTLDDIFFRLGALEAAQKPQKPETDYIRVIDGKNIDIRYISCITKLDKPYGWSVYYYDIYIFSPYNEPIRVRDLKNENKPLGIIFKREYDNLVNDWLEYKQLEGKKSELS
jgi:hypothetical protein